MMVGLVDQHVPWVLVFLWYDEAYCLRENVFFELDVEFFKLHKALFVNMKVNLKQVFFSLFFFYY